MGKPAGQLPHRLHFLRLAQRGLHFLLLLQRLRDSRFQCFVQQAQRLFRANTVRYILEQDSHLPVFERTDAEGGDFEETARRHQFALEPDRFATMQHAAIKFDPAIGFVRHHLTQFLADHVGDTGIAFIGGIRLDMDIVAQWSMRPIEKFDDAKTFVHRFEQRTIGVFASRQTRHSRPSPAALSACRPSHGGADR